MTAHYRKGWGMAFIVLGFILFSATLYLNMALSRSSYLNLIAPLLVLVMGFFFLNGTVFIFDKASKTIAFKALIGSNTRIIYYDAISYENKKVYFVINGKRKRLLSVSTFYVAKKDWEEFVKEIS